MTNQLDGDDLYQAAERYAATGTMRLPRLSALGCPSGLTYVFVGSSRKGMEDALLETLVLQPRFREGIYAAAGARILSAKGMASVGALGMNLEKGAHIRNRILMCASAEPAAVALLHETEALFAMAVIGYRSGLGDPVQVRAMAEELFERVRRLTPPVAGSCAAEDFAAFRKHAAEMAEFAAARHPWAPGCGVSLDEADYVLRCSGQKQGTME